MNIDFKKCFISHTNLLLFNLYWREIFIVFSDDMVLTGKSSIKKIKMFKETLKINLI